jgi:hypothetical protein
MILSEFIVLQAIFVTFSPKTPEEYLCLVGESQIDFYAMVDNNFCSLALPFKVGE